MLTRWLVAIFCIPPSFNALVDSAGDLPGPGAVALPVTMQTNIGAPGVTDFVLTPARAWQ